VTDSGGSGEPGGDPSAPGLVAPPTGPPTPALAPPPRPPVFGPPPPPVFASPGAAAGDAGRFLAGLQPIAALPPPTAATLAIPLGPRRLVGVSLDLLTRPDSGLRSASFYIGFLLLVTVGPAVALLGVALAIGADAGLRSSPSGPGAEVPAWFWWLLLAMVPASVGFLGAGVEARALASAVIGGRAEGRPLRLRESIAVTRARFWSVLGASLIVGILSATVQFTLLLLVGLSLQNGAAIGALDQAVSVAVGVIVGTPFIYAPAGIVLGETGVFEALRRSVRLAVARKRLAVVVTLFSVLSGLVVQFGLGIAVETISRLLSGTGVADQVAPALVIPIVAALVFAYGTLVLLTEAIAAAPAVHAFVALTYYTGGLERGRRAPLPVRHLWDPWVTPGLALAGGVAAVALVGGLLTLPWGG
jgi:hypothetical protein